jgi:hypothetical protein
MTTPATPDAPPLPMEVIGKANKNAQLDGLVFGSLAGTVSATLSLRLFKMSPRVSTFSGLAAVRLRTLRTYN